MSFAIAVYNFWIKCNYSLVANRLKSRGILNEDALHDALVDLYDAVCHSENITPDELNTIFNKTYRRYDKRMFRDERQYLHFEPVILDIIVSDNAEYSEEDKGSETSTERKYNHLKRVADRLLPIEDFKMLVLYETNDSITIDGLSLYTGIPKTTLSRKLRTIKKILKDNK